MRLAVCAALAALLSVPATGCVVVDVPGHAHHVVAKRRGPPPHAPAHGYRHKHHHHGVELRYDTGLGVYVVVGRSGVYYHDDHFYRLVDGGWQVSVKLDSGWKGAKHKHLPPGLAKKAHKKHKKHGKKHHR